MKLVAENSLLYLGNCRDEYHSEYVKIIKEKEQMRFVFLHQSPQDKYRHICIKYMENICIKQFLSHATLHLATYLLDIFMDNHCIIPERLHLVANVCLLLAAKNEETSSKIPKISQLNSCCGNRYSMVDYYNLEILFIQFFQYNLKFPCAVHYIFYYIYEIVTVEDLHGEKNLRTLFYDVYPSILKYLDRIIDDVHLMQFHQPSQLAAAVIAASRQDNGLTAWTSNLEKLTSYKMEDFDVVLVNLLSEQLRCPGCVNK